MTATISDYTEGILREEPAAPPAPPREGTLADVKAILADPNYRNEHSIFQIYYQIVTDDPCVRHYHFNMFSHASAGREFVTTGVDRGRPANAAAQLFASNFERIHGVTDVRFSCDNAIIVTVRDKADWEDANPMVLAALANNNGVFLRCVRVRHTECTYFKLQNQMFPPELLVG